MNRLLPLLLLLFTVLGVSVLAQPSSAGSKDENAVREVEDAIAAATDKNDFAALEKLWADDYIFVNPAGIIQTKADRIELFRSGRLKLESYSRDEETIRISGQTAIVIYRSIVKGQRGNLDISSQRRVTTILQKRRGRWTVIGQQSTPIVTAPRST